MAKRIGKETSKSYIANLENGVGKSISLNYLEKFAEALNVSVDDLVADSLKKYQQNNAKLSAKYELIQELQTSSIDKVKSFQRSVNEFLKYKESQESK